MKARLTVGFVLACVLIVARAPLSADTHAPQTETIQMNCGGAILTFVSPGFHAKAGQALETSQVGVAYLIMAGDQVVYESPAFSGIPSDMLTECDADGLTFFMILT